MLRSIAVAVVAALLVGCNADQPGTTPAQQPAAAAESAETSRDTFALGTTVTPEGAVPEEAAGEKFSRGGEVFLSINVAGASTEQAIEVEWVDSTGRVIRREAVEVPKGREYAAFSSGNTRSWPPGQHRAVVTINGRKVSERQFALM